MALVAAVVVAAGQGLRAGGEVAKQFRLVGGQTLLEHALTAFVRASQIALVQPVVRKDDLQLAQLNALESCEATTAVRAMPASADGRARSSRSGARRRAT